MQENTLSFSMSRVFPVFVVFRVPQWRLLSTFAYHFHRQDISERHRDELRPPADIVHVMVFLRLR